MIKTDAWTGVEHPYVGFWTIMRPPPGNAKDPTRARATNRLNVRLGSSTDLRRMPAERLECADEPTFGADRRLSAGKRTLGSDPPNFAFVPKAVIRKFAGHVDFRTPVD